LEGSEWICPICEYRHSRKMWHRLLENLETLCVQFGLKERRSCDVASGPRKAGDYAGRDSIADMGDNNGYAGGARFAANVGGVPSVTIKSTLR
jgi:hypothetical protein